MIWITQLSLKSEGVSRDGGTWLAISQQWEPLWIRNTSWDLDWFVKHRIKWKIRWEGDWRFLAQDNVFKTHTHENTYVLHKQEGTSKHSRIDAHDQIREEQELGLRIKGG